MKGSISFALLVSAAAIVACSSSSETTGGQGGGTAKGGASSGGAASGGATSGATNGGMNSGGTIAGASGNGGSVASGGSPSGGASASGGSVNGGASANGGSVSGGANAGSSSGGSSNGGNASAGTSNGGTSNGGTSNGGASSGGKANGGSSNGGVGGSGTAGQSAGGSGGTGPVGASDLPVPAGAANTPKPSGTVGGFKVLNWAGFKGAISFTFDDALQSQLDNYAKFKATGVRMTFYLVCGNDGMKPGWKTIAQDGNELGNHTNHHCYANGTSCAWGTFTDTGSEFDDCTAHLKSAFGVKDVYTCASPMGDMAWNTAASTRFLANRGVQDNANGVAPNDNTNPYELPSHGAAMMEKAVGGFNTVTDSARTNGKWRILLIHSVGNNDGYNPVDANEVVAAMTYAKGLGDVWIDTVANVAAYWRAQKLLSALTPSTAGTSSTWTWTLPAHFPPSRYLRVTVTGGTLSQNGTPLSWDAHGYYEVALDAGSVTLAP